MKNKFKKLSKYLEESNKTKIVLSFKDIEAIIGEKLPENALKAEWWWNLSASEIAKCWMSKGYKTKEVAKTINRKSITFQKEENDNISAKKISCFQRFTNFCTNEDHPFRKKVLAALAIPVAIFAILGGLYGIISYYDNHQNNIIKNNKFDEYYEFGEKHLKEHNYSEAIDNYILSLYTYDELNIPFDIDSIKSFVRIAEIYEKMGLYNEALKYYKYAIFIIEELNLDKEIYLDIYINTGYIYLQLTEFEKAEERFDEAIKLFNKDEISAFEKLVSDIFSEYGIINCQKEDINELGENTDIFKEKIRNVDENRLRLYLKILVLRASIDMFRGNYEKAVGGFEQVLSFYNFLYTINFLDNNIDNAMLYDAISICYDNLGYTKKANEYNQFAIDIFNDKYGERNIDTGISYGNFAMQCLSMNEYEKAYEYFRRSAAIIKHAIGNDNEIMACTYNNMGLYFDYTGDYEQAEAFYLMSIDIYDGLETQNSGFIRTCLNYSMCLINMNRYDEANKIVDDIYYLIPILVGEDSEEYRLYEYIKNLLQYVTFEEKMKYIS